MSINEQSVSIPISWMFGVSCLIAHMIQSIIVLKISAGKLTKTSKQLFAIDYSKVKKLTQVSTKELKSYVIIGRIAFNINGSVVSKSQFAFALII